MKNLIKKMNSPEAKAMRKAAAQLELHNSLNQFQIKSHCISDKASSLTMACHNIGAGGVSVFCSTNENMYSIKRMSQRNSRLQRANGIRA